MPAEASEVNFGSETVKATVAKIAMAISGFVGTVLFARLLDPTLLGGFYLLLGLVKIADRPIYGWAIATKKRFSEPSIRDSSILGAQIIFILIWLILVAVVSYFLSNWLRAYTKLSAAPMLFIVLLISEPVYEPLEKLLQGRGQISIATWSDTFRSYLTLPLQLMFVLAGFGAAGLVYGLAAATVLSVPLVLYFLRTPPALPSVPLLQSLWQYAQYSIPSGFFGTIYDRFDVLLLGVLATPAAAGYYEIAAKLTLPAVFISSAAASGLMARVSNLQSKQQDVASDITNTLAFSSILAIPIFFGALALPKTLIITFYGAEYAPAATLLVAIAAYRVTKSQNAPLTQTVNGLDRPDMTMRISAVTLAINVVLGVLLVRQIGPVGVAIATLLAEVIRYLSLSIIVNKYTTGVKLLPEALLKQFGAGILMFAVVSLLRRTLSVKSYLGLLLLLTIGAITYGTTFLISSSQSRQLIRDSLEDSMFEELFPNKISNQ